MPLPEMKFDDDYTWLAHLNASDLVNYGLLPELVRQFKIMVPVQPLDEQTLVGILTKSDNPMIASCEEDCEKAGIELSFDKDAIAQIALEMKNGATGLKTVLDGVVSQLKSEAKSLQATTIRVTRDAVRRWKKVK